MEMWVVHAPTINFHLSLQFKKQTSIQTTPPTKINKQMQTLMEKVHDACTPTQLKLIFSPKTKRKKYKAQAYTNTIHNKNMKL
eukprot:m.142256 g.142256  ORF g.142256 m.142256 type:complete len:83 (+) comp48275_c0_seq1:23-271(+)